MKKLIILLVVLLSVAGCNKSSIEDKVPKNENRTCQNGVCFVLPDEWSQSEENDVFVSSDYPKDLSNISITVFEKEDNYSFSGLSEEEFASQLSEMYSLLLSEKIELENIKFESVTVGNRPASKVYFEINNSKFHIRQIMVLIDDKVCITLTDESEHQNEFGAVINSLSLE